MERSIKQKIQGQAINLNRNPRQFMMMMMMMVFCIGNLSSILHETNTRATDVIFFLQNSCFSYSY
jgi:hypothetical protein